MSIVELIPMESFLFNRNSLQLPLILRGSEALAF